MDVNINFFGCGVNISAEEVIEVGELTKGASLEAIKQAISATILAALTGDEFPEYEHDGHDENFFSEVVAKLEEEGSHENVQDGE